MNFSQILTNLKSGRSAFRTGWNGTGMFITLQVPDENSKMTNPYLYMTCPVGSTKQFGEGEIPATNMIERRIPWLCSQTDLLAEDWELVAEGTVI